MKTNARPMFRSTTTLLVTLILMISAALSACSGKHEADPDTYGSTTMQITLPSGQTINSVQYRITGNSITPITGSVNVSGPGSTVSFLIGGIPQGMGYLVELTATTTDGVTTCGGQATFNVIAGQITQVTVALQCQGDNNGGVVVNGVWCPTIASYTASPLAASVGGTISVAATAYDLDATDDATPTFAWSASAGTFASATSSATSYTCTTAGTQTITINVGATSPTVNVSSCADTAAFTVTCVPLSCGNGTVDTGEQCDPPNGMTCDNNCLQIPVCGNNVVEAPAGPYPAEQCDPPNGTTCNAMCQTIPTVCGDGIVQPGEQCDPPNGTTCSATCQNIAAATCGDGTVNQPSEQCEPPNTAAGNYTPSCDAMCQAGATLCQQCEAQKCDAFFGAPGAWGCAGLTGAAKTNCEALIGCIRTTHCAAATNDAQACFCGTASDLACLTGSANGACKGQYETAAGTTDPSVIAGLFTDPSSPVGLANNQITCDADTTSTPSCTNVCPL
jgi:cysteine-rich repeat protein